MGLWLTIHISMATLALARPALTPSLILLPPLAPNCGLLMLMAQCILILLPMPQETLQSEQAVEMCFSQNSLEAQPPQLIYICRQQQELERQALICISLLEAMEQQKQ